MKFSHKIENLLAFQKYNFFSVGAWEQKLCRNNLKMGEIGHQKKFTKNLKKELNIFSHGLFLCLNGSFDSLHLDW